MASGIGSWERRKKRGFSVIELAVVAAIAVVIVAMAAPSVMASMERVRLRSAANSAAAVVQSTRMAAVKNNTYYSAALQTVSSGGGTYTQVFADFNRTSSYSSGEPMAQLPSNVRFDASGANPSFNYTALLGSTFTPQAASVPPSFNARGLPCLVSGSLCNQTTGGGGQVAFLYFMRLDGATGTKWASISVTPAGRIRVWTWDGRNWE